MAQPSLKDIINDPEFQNLPETEKVKVFKSVDPNFAKMSGRDQNQVMLKLMGGASKRAMQEPKIGVSHIPRTDMELQPGHEQIEPDKRFGGKMSVAALDAGVKPERQVRPGAEVVSQIARPVISGMASAGGAMAGTVGATPGLGTVAGGAIGYAAGEEIADKLDEFLGLRERQPLTLELQESAEDIVEGATYEMGGQSLLPILGKTIKPIWKWAVNKIPSIPLTKEGAKVVAGKQLIAEMKGSGPIIAKNYEEARELERLIPGLEFRVGELTNDPGIIKWERARARMPGDTASGQLEQSAKNYEAVQTYIDKSKGGEGLSDVKGILQTEREAVETGLTTAQKQLERETASLDIGSDIMEGGEQIRRVAREGEKQAKKVGGKLFEGVPQFEIDGKRILDKIDDISEPFTRMEKVDKNIPEEFAWFKEKIGETGGVVTPQDLQDMSSDIGEAIATIKNNPAATKSQRMQSKRLALLKGEVDTVLDEAGEVGGIVKPKVVKPSVEVGPKEELKALSNKIEKEGVGFDAFYNKNNDSFELSRIVVPESQRDTGIGSNAMKELINLADKRGKIITLTPSKDFGGKIGKLKKFYKKLGFVENKGANKDYRFRDTYLREPIKSKFVSEKPTTTKPTTTQARYKGKIIYPEKIKKEISEINKKLKSEPHTTSNEIDVKKTYKGLSDKNVLGIMQNVNESNADYAKRIANQYKIHLKKDAPLVPGKERPAITSMKKKLDEMQKMLLESTDVKVSEMAEAAGQLKTARTFWRKEVIQKFKHGTVGEILKPGTTGDKVKNAHIASKFFQPKTKGIQSADEFINAIGDNKDAREALTDYIKQDLISEATNPATGEITDIKLKSWLKKYKPALKKYGLENRFNTLQKARSELDSALEIKDSFNKSVASKILDSDVDTAVKNSFASGSKGAAARKLMNQMKGDKQGIKGLQNALIDHIIETSKTTASDAFNNPIISFAGLEKGIDKYKAATAVLFKDSPGKLKALNTYRNAMKVLQRGKTSPLGGGSDSAENVMSMLSGSRAVNIVKALISPIKNMSDKQVNALLNRAAYDPDFAYTLMFMSKERSKDMIEQRLKGHLSSMGMRSTGIYKSKKGFDYITDKLSDKKE